MVWCGVRYVIWSGTDRYGPWFGTTWSGAKLLWFIPVWSAMVKTFGHMVTVVVKGKIEKTDIDFIQSDTQRFINMFYKV